MNHKLKDDPNYNIPANFKKVYEREVELKYELPKIKGVKNSYTMCYEILHDMVNEAFNVQVIEPQARFYYKTRVKPRDDFMWRDDTVLGDVRSVKHSSKAQAKMLEQIKKKEREKMLKDPQSFKIPESQRAEFLKDFTKRKSLKSEFDSGDEVKQDGKDI